MSLCFFCNERLDSERTRVSSSSTPHSNTPYPEKIDAIVGEECLVIVTPTDQMCMQCTSLLNYFDECENKLKLYKNWLSSNLQLKHEVLPPDQAIKDVEVVNGHLITEEQLEQIQHNISNGLTVGASPTVTTAALVTVGASTTVTTAAVVTVEASTTVTTAAVVTVEASTTVTTAAVVTQIETPLKLLKAQQQQPQQQEENTKKIEIFKCGSCAFQSNELGDVRFHSQIHTNKTQKKSILNQAADTTLTTAIETEGYVDVTEEKKTENAGYGEEIEHSQKKDTTAKEAKSIKKPDDRETSDSVKKEVGEDNANVENQGVSQKTLNQ